MKRDGKNQLRVRELLALSAVFSLLVSCKPAQAITRVVNSTADNQSNGCTTNAGDCTLREAISASATNDTINFAANLSGGTIILTGGELSIGQNLTISGPGGRVTVQRSAAAGTPNFRIFNITSGTVHLANLIISGGRMVGAEGASWSLQNFNGGPGGDIHGGGILNQGTLTLTNCTLSSNTAAGGPGGWAIAAGTGGGGGAGEGGGIFNQGTLTLLNCTLSGNTAPGGSGGSGVKSQNADGGPGGMGRGGGIFNQGTLTLLNSTLSSNSAVGGQGGDKSSPGDDGTGGSGNGGNGGHANGGAFFNNSGTLSLTNCTLSSNSAAAGVGGTGIDGGDGGNANGGGCFNGASLTLTNCTLSSNIASGGTGGRAFHGHGGHANGGGLASDNSALTSSTLNTIIAGNLAGGGAPGFTGMSGGGFGTGIGPDVGGSANSQGHNLIGDSAGSSGFTQGVKSDQVGGNGNPVINPHLGPLANNGGPTQTRALLPGSLAINAGSDAVLSTLTTDQRGPGFPRKIGVSVDIGAFEFDPPQSGSAFLVNTTADHDDGVCGVTDCTLRDALTVANANPDASIINFQVGLSGTIPNTLLPFGLPITQPVTINGPGARTLTISGNSVSRVFTLSSGVSATISGLTIANGKVSGSGGGILNTGGTLNLTNVTLSGNAGGNGGGIFNGGGTLMINSSTVSGNTVSSNFVGGSGGGIFNSGGTLIVINSTISGNTAIGPGGNSDSGGGIITNVGTVTLTNSTITGNTGDIGGGIRNINGGTVTSKSTIIALNTSANGPDVNGPLTSQGFNLIGSDTGATITPAQASDQINVEPANVKLGALENNGGPTDTIAPLPGSRAIDAGSSTLSTDQRGQARPYDNPAVINVSGGDGSDIGAFEVQLLPSLVVSNPRAFLEGSAASPGSTNFNVLLSAPSVQTVRVAYRTADGLVNGAKAGEDYIATNGTLVFAPGQTRKAVSVNFLGENIAELNETFFLDIHTPVNASIADSRGAAYIGNDDGPSIVIDNARAVSEGNSGTTNQSFLVRLSAASSNTITVDWANSPNTAGPADYVVANGRLTFAPGETQKTIIIQVKGDTSVEPTETYRVNLTRPTFAIIADSQGIGYILNDDVAPSSVVRDAPSK